MHTVTWSLASAGLAWPAVPAADLVAAAAVSSVTCAPSPGRATPVCGAGRRLLPATYRERVPATYRQHAARPLRRADHRRRRAAPEPARTPSDANGPRGVPRATR